MKKSNLIFVVIICSVAAIGIWWISSIITIPIRVNSHSSKPILDTENNTVTPNETTDNESIAVERFGAYADLSVSELWKQKPKTFKIKGYPPQTPEEINLWQWWRAISQADKKFQHKTPIAFYGKVVDQNSQPITEARIDLVWSVIGGTENRTLQTGSDGLFFISGIQGKGITVYASKEGFLTGLQGKGGFEYADFIDGHNFHIPDPNNLVVFQLFKKGESEPMYKWYPTAYLAVDGKATWLDIKTGRIAGNGDVLFSILRDTGPDSRMSCYKLRVVAANGGGIAISEDEEFMFLAPAEGYQPSLEIVQKAGDPQFKVS